MSAHVILNLLTESSKRDKIRGSPSILSFFRNEFNKFNNTGARMLDSIDMYHILKSHFDVKMWLTLKASCHYVFRKSVNHQWLSILMLTK